VDSIKVQGRLLSHADLDSIRQLRRDHPEWSRQRLSIYLAKQWQWRNQAGRLKDMAARTLLLKLHARGLIQLPAPLRAAGQRRRGVEARLQLEWLHPWPPAIEGLLQMLRPVALELVQSLSQRRRVKHLLQHYHYRGFSGAVGENVQYVARDASGRELAAMVFGAAAWKVASRDQFIGWSVSQRTAGLLWIANQQRFLILPWVRVPHLASHLLALAARRLSTDWQSRYGHPVWLIETFVEQERFSGTCYQAAGWQPLGCTTGRTRQDRARTLQTPLKTIWIKALHPQFRNLLASR
jgi:hypothetical protein